MAYTFKTNDSTNLELINALEVNGVEYKLDALLAANKAASVETKVGKKLQDIVINYDEINDEDNPSESDTPATWTRMKQGPWSMLMVADEEAIITYPQSDFENVTNVYVDINNSGSPILCEISSLQGLYLIVPYDYVGYLMPNNFAVELYQSEDENGNSVFFVEGIFFDPTSELITSRVKDTDSKLIISISTIDTEVSRNPLLEPNYGVVALKVNEDDGTSDGQKWYYKVHRISAPSYLISRNRIFGVGSIDLSNAEYPSEESLAGGLYGAVGNIKITGSPYDSSYELSSPVYKFQLSPHEITYQYYESFEIIGSRSGISVPHNGSLPEGMIFDWKNSQLYVNSDFVINNTSFPRNGFITFSYVSDPLGVLSEIDMTISAMFQNVGANIGASVLFVGVYQEDIAKSFLKTNSVITGNNRQMVEPSTIQSLDAEFIKKVILGGV